MLHPLLKNVFSSRLVSTLAITTHAPRCCEDCARLVADKLANGKEPKEGRQGCAIAIAIMGYRYSLQTRRPLLKRKQESRIPNAGAVNKKETSCRIDTL
jgi:hypothetical protein